MLICLPKKKKETATERAPEPFREEAIKKKGWKKEGKWKKRRKKKRNKTTAKFKKSTRTRWWSKIRKSFVSALTRKWKEEKEEKMCRSTARHPKTRQGLGRRRRLLLLLLLLGQSMLGVSAAAEGSRHAVKEER